MFQLREFKLKEKTPCVLFVIPTLLLLPHVAKVMTTPVTLPHCYIITRQSASLDLHSHAMLRSISIISYMQSGGLTWGINQAVAACRLLSLASSCFFP